MSDPLREARAACEGRPELECVESCLAWIDGILSARQEGGLPAAVARHVARLAGALRDGDVDRATRAAEQLRSDVERWVEDAETILPAGGPVAEIRVVEGGGRPDRIVLRPGGEILVGTAPGCDLVLDDPAAGDRRCRIVYLDGSLTIEVLPPHEAVAIGESAATLTTLERGDRIRLGPRAVLEVDFGPGRRDSARIDLDPVSEAALDDSERDLLVEVGETCAGGCGLALEPVDVEAGRAIRIVEGTFCIDCIAGGAGPFEVRGGYAIVHKIDEGGMGEVYLAVDRTHRRPVAFKILRGLDDADPEMIVRFCREAMVGRSLEHPNIVAFLDSGEVDGTPFLVMEYVRGKTLRRVLRKRGRLDENLAVRIAHQVTKALCHAADRDIVHRDIKPENVMIDRERRVRLLDMGLAKRMSTAGRSGITAARQRIGTLAYMAPEQIEDACFADQRSDIYSVGVVLYEMIAGERPFTAVQSGDLCQRIQAGRCRPLPELAPAVSGDLAGVVARAMAVRPGDRYQRPGDLHRALRALRRGKRGAEGDA